MERVVANPSPSEYTAQHWIDEAQAGIRARRDHMRGGDKRARNVVMFLGDGMSVPTLAAARTLLGQRTNRPATAYLCGVKANRGTIGLSAAVPRYNCSASLDNSARLDSIAAWALADGRDAGVVTTTRITHASPAGAFAKVANRHWENDAEVKANNEDPNICPDIAYQLVHSDPGKQFKYHLESDTRTEPTLAELTEVAIRSLSRNEKGFFLFVEGGRIDHAHHDNQVELALDETIEFSAAVARATELLSDDDSLIVVTADHAHVMTFNGYTRRGGDILGPSDDRDESGVPYMTLSYSNGPGFRPHVNNTRVDVTRESNYRQLEWMSHVDVPLESETHGGDDVAVFASGPHHQMFSGLYEQSQLPHLMAYAACIGPGQHACNVAVHHVLAKPLMVAFTLFYFLKLFRVSVLQ
ncbi:unnamed protein product, partial [Iphiclides podalirius]